MRLTANEQKVLAVLSDDGAYLAFVVIMDRSGLDRKAVRRACRSLARKGLAKYGRGLWTEDGEMYGSGYSATHEGNEAIDLATSPKQEPAPVAVSMDGQQTQ